MPACIVLWYNLRIAIDLVGEQYIKTPENKLANTSSFFQEFL